MNIKDLDKEIEEMVWKLMVGCATGNIEPNQKDEYINKFKSLLSQSNQEIVKEIEGLQTYVFMEGTDKLVSLKDVIKIITQLRQSNVSLVQHKDISVSQNKENDTQINLKRRSKIMKKTTEGKGIKINCPNCGKPMKQVWDKIAKKYTGHLWRCSCMSKDTILSIG
jgi:hypothetical protein